MHRKDLSAIHYRYIYKILSMFLSINLLGNALILWTVLEKSMFLTVSTCGWFDPFGLCTIEIYVFIYMMLGMV